MAHFAEINQDGVVLRVIVAEQDFIDSGAVGNPANWIQTSYNTMEGEHKLGGNPLRKNFAAIGYTYDRERDAFVPPRQYPSWVLDEQKCVYVAPKSKPNSKNPQAWDEEKKEWKELKDAKITA